MFIRASQLCPSQPSSLWNIFWIVGSSGYFFFGDTLFSFPRWRPLPFKCLTVAEVPTSDGQVGPPPPKELIGSWLGVKIVKSVWSVNQVKHRELILQILPKSYAWKQHRDARSMTNVFCSSLPGRKVWGYLPCSCSRRGHLWLAGRVFGKESPVRRAPWTQILRFFRQASSLNRFITGFTSEPNK